MAREPFCGHETPYLVLKTLLRIVYENIVVTDGKYTAVGIALKCFLLLF